MLATEFISNDDIENLILTYLLTSKTLFLSILIHAFAGVSTSTACCTAGTGLGDM